MTDATVTGLRVNRLVEPIALDGNMPTFSWMLQSDVRGARQVQYRVAVDTHDGVPVWDSGVVVSARSTAVALGDGGTMHRPLEPEHRYVWRVVIGDERGQVLEANSRFETGIFIPSQVGWSGAQWIGADRPHLDAASLVVFRIRARIRIPRGSAVATLVLGANDFRLQDRVFNELGVAGPNHVACSIDVSEPESPTLSIYRSGYAPGDDADVPILTLTSTNSNLTALLPAATVHEDHEIEVVCWSSALSFRVDGHDVDSAGETQFAVNPRGTNDVASFPNLAEVGFGARAGEQILVRGYEIRTFRPPEAALFDQRDYGVFEGIDGIDVDGDLITVDGGPAGRLIHRDPSRGALPVLRRLVELDAKPEHAKLNITARGIYEFEINGTRVGDDWFNPGVADYRHTIEYSAYDVTHLLRAGSNSIVVRLAPGWWSDMVSFMRVNTGFFGDRPSALITLAIDKADGTRELVVSEPGRWQVRTDGPTKSGSFFQGERYDARDEVNLAAASGWTGAALVTPLERNAQPSIVPKSDRPVRVHERLGAHLVGETRPGSGSWIYDLGVNMVGVPEIDIDLPAGRTIVIRTAEMLYPMLPEYRERDIDGLLMTENLREALSTDFYITRDGAQTIRPRFTFHGFRFLEITGVDEPLAERAVRGLVLSSLPAIAGDVSTSDPMLNQLMANIHRSQIGNFLSIPMDCPQRNERLGWLEAVTEFARTSCFTSDVESFYERFLRIVRDSQVTEELLATKTDLSNFHERGDQQSVEDPGRAVSLFTGKGVAGMYPSYVPGYDAYRSWGTPWSSAGVLVPHELYRHYGDTKVVRDSFVSMRTYLEAMDQLRIPGSAALSADGGTCGDWLSLDKPPYTYTDVTVYAHTLRCFAEMADAIGEHEAAAEYSAKYAAARAEWNELFVDSPTGRFRDDPSLVNTSQSSCVLPLFYDLPFESSRQSIFEALCEKVQEGYGGQPFAITTGPLHDPDDQSRALRLRSFRSRLRDDREPLLPVVALPSHPGSDLDLGAMELVHARARLRRKQRHEFVQSLLARRGRCVGSSNRVAGIDRDPSQPGMQHVPAASGPGRVHRQRLRVRHHGLRTSRGELGVEQRSVGMALPMPGTGQQHRDHRAALVPPIRHRFPRARRTRDDAFRKPLPRPGGGGGTCS